MEPATDITILIVDDETSVRKMLDRRLSKVGYLCHGAESGLDALDKLYGNHYVLVITDIRMPGMSGFELIHKIHEIDETLSVIVMTAYTDVETAIEALRHGAFDYFTKPMEFDKLEISIANAVQQTKLLRENVAYQNELERKVAERTEELKVKNERIRQFFIDTTMALVTAVEAKDKYTEGHSRRVAHYAKKLAVELDLMPDDVEKIYVAGILHDIGKIGIPDTILQKPGALTHEERLIIQTHPQTSADILAHIEDFNIVSEMISSHHERIDGNGYPDRLRGDRIPFGARILAVADTFDAMVSARPYRKNMPLEVVLQEMERIRGTQLDTDIVEVFINLVKTKEIVQDS